MSLATASLGPAGNWVELLLIRLSAHPTDAQSDCNLGDLKADSVPVALCCVIPDLLFLVFFFCNVVGTGLL